MIREEVRRKIGAEEKAKSETPRSGEREEEKEEEK